LDIEVTVFEGERYYVGDINWENNTVFDDLIIADMIGIGTGDVFSEGDYHFTLQQLHALYADRGYIYITVEPVREIIDNKVNVTFRFLEGEPARIRDIQIVDNLKTHDNVILRQLRIFPGDVFSNARIGQSQRDIFQLGYFEDVQPDFRPVGQEGDVDLIFKVKERQTGQFMFGMAYSAQTSLTGFIQVAETNFRGKGQNISVAWQFGSRRRYVDLSFTEPWFRGTPTLLGFDLFDRFQYNVDDFYESRVRGFSVRMGRRIPGTRFSRIGIRYELSNTRLSNFSPAYVAYLDGLERQLGTTDLPWQRLDRVDWPRSKSAIRLTLSRNSTDNPFFPTGGSRTSYSFELSGGPLGGELDFQEHLLSQSYYQSLPLGFALHVRGYFGLLIGLDNPNEVPEFERYRLGGNRIFPLRGYNDLEVVPRGNPIFIGGRFFTIFNLEVLYPLTRAVQVLAFLDQGDTWNSFSETDFTNLRRGAGFGIRVEVPMMGNIGFDYGYGFDRIGGPSWQPHFNIGSFF
jgi:outer membrane protein insertion porin family